MRTKNKFQITIIGHGLVIIEGTQHASNETNSNQFLGISSYIYCGKAVNSKLQDETDRRTAFILARIKL